MAIESWHIQYSHCFFLCCRFSDPSVLFFWLIYSSAFSITMAKAISFGRKTIFPSPHFLQDGEDRTSIYRPDKTDHLDREAHHSEARSARLQSALAKTAWGTDHVPHQQHSLLVRCLTYSSLQRWVLQWKTKTADSRPSSSCSELNNFLICTEYYVPLLEVWLPSLAWLTSLQILFPQELKNHKSF